MKAVSFKGLFMALAVILVTGLLFAQAAPDPVEKRFAPGGRIEIQLSAGDYQVRPGTDNRIRVTLSGNTGNSKVTLNTNGTHADLDISNSPHNNFHATIEVPAAADLRIRLEAGNLEIGLIKGNKDIESHAGNVEVMVGDPKEYGKVDASILAGNIDAAPFDAAKGGLFRSFKWSGPGRYSLRAHLGAGNLELRR
jgi:hypothetical protein